MPAKRHTLSVDHPVVIAFLIFMVIGFLYFASEVLKPLALAVLLSFALTPVASFIERRGLPRFLSVVLTVLLALGVMGGIGYKVGEQLTTLALGVDKDRLEHNIRNKMGSLPSKQRHALDKIAKLGTDLAKALDSPRQVKGAVPVNVISSPSYTERLSTAIGPYLENLSLGVFILILVLFIIAGREDLNDRLVSLFGRSRVTVTTKTVEEVSQRISRYLLMFATVNSAIGLIVALGLWAIGVPLAILWGVLTALFRFIPYVGAAIAFSLPLLFSVATFPGWYQPLMVIVLFAVIETLANSYFEPVIYGKTTGVTALGLLVAAMFWTWLWGGLGLLLSTPLTVCLAVLGKYVPGLGVFATMLMDDPPMEADLRFYQRLVAMDPEGADHIIEEEFKQHPRAEVFDRVLLPALSRAERDHQRNDIDDGEWAFIRRFIGELLDELEATPEVDLKTLGIEPDRGENHPAPGKPGCVLGVTAKDSSDGLALRMLSMLLQPWGLPLTILSDAETPLTLSDRITDCTPELVILSNLPPARFATSRYLYRKLRNQFAGLSILVGRWGENGPWIRSG